MALQVLRWLFALTKDTQPEAKVVVGAAGSFHSAFSTLQTHPALHHTEQRLMNWSTIWMNDSAACSEYGND